MEDKRPLESIPDDELLRRLAEILQQSRRVESDLVAHIAEVDERKLYAREASPSMFAYCTDVLHLSEAEAYLRIAAARAARKHPMLLDMLGDSRLHLTGIALLAPLLTGENRDALLKRATHRTKRQIEELIAEMTPRPDVPAVMRKLPERPALRPDGVGALGLGPEKVSVPILELRPDAVEAPASTPRASTPAPPAIVQPLSPGRYKVQFTASAELHDMLKRLQALMGSRDLAAVVQVAVTEKLERLERRRFAKTSAPRKGLRETDISPSKRYIPAPVRRAVSERDGYRCRYVDSQGRRCPERGRLDYHHRYPWALGGDPSPKNICLMCQLCRYRHNRHYAGSAIMPRRPKALWDVQGSWGFELPLVGIIPPLPHFPFRSVDREEEAWMRYGSGSLDH